MLLNIHSCTYLPSVYLLWWSFCSCILPIFFYWVVHFLIVDFKSSLFISDNSIFIRNRTYLQIFSPSVMPSQSFKSPSWSKIFHLNKVKFIIFNLLKVLHGAKFFILIKSNLSFFFHGLFLDVTKVIDIPQNI